MGIFGVDRSLATRVISTAGQGFAAAAAALESVGQPRGGLADGRLAGPWQAFRQGRQA